MNVTKLALSFCRSVFSSVKYCTEAISSYKSTIPKTSLLTANSCISKTSSIKYLEYNKNSGDDAWFQYSNPFVIALGVADGVGGWRSYGVDPSHFSQLLMHNCLKLLQSGKFISTNPVKLLSSAYCCMKENKKTIIGSSTACLVILDKNSSTLFTANLGDSGYMIIRDGVIVHRSREQQHYFNTPYQLSIVPFDKSLDTIHDSPELSNFDSYQVVENDIVLLATDGFFDNLSDFMILKEISNITSTTSPDLKFLQKIAQNLVREANLLSSDPTYLSPFAKSAKEYGFNFRGGKPDDITVLLSLVVGNS